MDDGPIVAQLNLIMKNEQGQQRCDVIFHIPRMVETGDWACRAYVTGLRGKPWDIRGENSLQALHLALAFIGSYLKTAMKSGTEFFHLDDSRPLELEFYFPNKI